MGKSYTETDLSNLESAEYAIDSIGYDSVCFNAVSFHLLGSRISMDHPRSFFAYTMVRYQFWERIGKKCYLSHKGDSYQASFCLGTMVLETIFL